MRVLVVLLYVLSPLLFGHTYLYHPQLSAYLGGGFSPESVEESYLECVEWASEEILDSKQGTYHTEVSINAIQSQQELLKELGVSASISANSYFASGSAGVSYLDSYQFEESSLTWVLSAKADFGRVGLEGIKLHPFAQKLLDEGKYLEFEKRCGTHFVDRERRGGSIFAIYSLHDLSASQKRQFEAYLEVSLKSTAFSGAAEASFKQLLLEASKTNHLDLHILTLGGEGLKQFSELPSKLTDVDKIKSILGNYLNTLDFAHSVPMEYHIRSMEVFGFHKDVLSNIKKRDMVLEKLYFEMQHKQNTFNKLHAILTQWNTLYTHLNKEDKKDYETYSETVSKEIEQLYSAAELCLEKPENCKLPSPYDASVRIPWPDPYLDNIEGWSRIEKKPNPPLYPITNQECIELQKKAFLSGCITKKELSQLRVLNAAPFCFLGKLYEWSQCNEKGL